MSEPYNAQTVGELSHPCAIDMERITPTRYRIVFQHEMSGDRCKRCGESLDWPKIRSNTAPVDTGTPDA